MVLILGPGATFGEIALLKDDPQDCKRTASIIANEETIDLIEIDRDLYNRYQTLSIIYHKLIR